MGKAKVGGGGGRVGYWRPERARTGDRLYHTTLFSWREQGSGQGEGGVGGGRVGGDGTGNQLNHTPR